MTPKRTISAASRMAVLAAAVSTATLLGACAPLLIGGAMVSTALSVTDRRTGGAQLEDQSIELKAINRVREAAGSASNVNVTSYNRTVLLTGEVPTDAARTATEQAVARIENVRATVNELAVMGTTTLSARSNDAILGSKVKAAYVDAKDLQANAIKVVAERGTIYLMGRVTEREANRATELARSTSGVGKVVRVFEILSEAELAALQSR
ncbi:MAG: BON domain-containing protein [Aquabacterium sp.]|nr:BON domain-containing protein [Aquabacterium sp.]